MTYVTHGAHTRQEAAAFFEYLYDFVYKVGHSRRRPAGFLGHLTPRRCGRLVQGAQRRRGPTGLNSRASALDLLRQSQSCAELPVAAAVRIQSRKTSAISHTPAMVRTVRAWFSAEANKKPAYRRNNSDEPHDPTLKTAAPRLWMYGMTRCHNSGDAQKPCCGARSFQDLAAPRPARTLSDMPVADIVNPLLFGTFMVLPRKKHRA